ncbi:hypothetical protein [Brachybacterium timonense]|uniref:hypothetical protein n=1 Tax=Brachybacterium timonense TaxID=2050896 RepID=UPI00110F0DEF|nr:hypothetical protein [Brachybacterium timonense]
MNATRGVHVNRGAAVIPRGAAALPRWAAVAVAVVTAARLYQDTSWVGDWNQTASSLGAMGMLGGTIAALLMAIDAQRNWRALHEFRSESRGRRSSLRVTVAEVWKVLHWPLAGWLFVVMLAYAITAGANPQPTEPSAWPLVAATLFVSIQVLLGHLLGLRVHAAIAAPALVIFGFVLPAAVGSLEPSKIAHFTTSTSYWIALPSVPSPAFYGSQSAVFAGVTLLLAVLIHEPLRWSTRALSAGLALLLIVVSASSLLDTEERLHDLTDVSRQVCAQGHSAEVCVFTDHERFLPVLLVTADEVMAVLPADARPARLVETGLRTEPEDALLSTANVPVGPAESVVNSVAGWHVCDSEAAFERFSFVAARSGFDPAEGEFVPHIMEKNEEQQLDWWREGLVSEC